MSKLAGKVAIVTGAAQGIGAEYARGLAREGAAVALCDVADPQAVVDEIIKAGGKAIGAKVDITDGAGVAAFAKRANDELGGLHILVNNAALFTALDRKPFTAIDTAEWDKVMTVNVRGTFECCKAAYPFMEAQGYGKIINISSSTVHAGQPLLLHYVTSKGAIIALTRSLAREGGPVGVRVNCIAPGFTLSEGVQSKAVYTKEVTSRIAATRAIARDQMPDDLVGAVVFLASPDSDFVTGQTMVVDGGTNMVGG